jgi:hypothetical protein
MAGPADTNLYDGSDETEQDRTVHNISPLNTLMSWIAREKAAATHVQAWREQAEECFRFINGYQTSAADAKALKAARRPNNAFNSTQKFIRYITGIERVAPSALIYSAIDESDVRQQIYGEFMTRCYDWFLQQSDGNFERARAFYDLCVCGMGWCDYYVDRSRDARGLPMMTRLDPMEMWWPDVDRQNLVNSRWRGRETMISLEEACNRWPDDENIITAYARGQDVFSGAWLMGNDKTIVHTLREVETTGEETPRLSTKDEVEILEWQWYDEEMGYYFMDPIEQQDVWLDDKAFRAYKSDLLMKARYKITDYARQVRRVYRKVFSLNGRYQLGDVIDIPGNRFTFNPMTGTFDSENRYFYGYAKILLDPQTYANKFFNQVIEIMAHQAKGGLLYEKGAVLPNQLADLNDNFTTPGTSQEVNVNAISQNQIRDKPLPQLPAASIAVLQFCIQSMDSITGLSPEAAFNGPVADTPGVTLRQKTQSSMVLLNQEFDSLSRFRIEEGRVIFNMLGILADDRLIKVGGAFDGSVIKFLKQPFALEYDMLLDDTERDPNIQAMYRDSIMQLAPTLIRMNKFLPELLDYVKFIPVKIRLALKKAIMASAQADQEAAAQGQSRGGRPAPESPEERQARVQKIGADTQLQMVKAQRVAGQQKRDEMKTLIDAIFKAGQLQIEKAKVGIEHQKMRQGTSHKHLDVASDLIKQAVVSETQQQTAKQHHETAIAVARAKNNARPSSAA